MSQDSGGFGGYNPPPSGGSGFKPIGNGGFGVQPLGSTPLGGDLHETFGVSRNGDILRDHVTIQLPGFRPFHLDP